MEAQAAAAESVEHWANVHKCASGMVREPSHLSFIVYGLALALHGVARPRAWIMSVCVQFCSACLC